MKRVLLDHCVPRRIRQALTNFDTATAFKQGWAQLTNGALIKAAEDAGFDVLITADKNLRYQQSLVGVLRFSNSQRIRSQTCCLTLIKSATL